MDHAAFPPVPGPLAGLIGLAPPPLLAPALDRILRETLRSRPDLVARLGVHATKTFLIDPTDLPLVFLVRPDPARPSIEARRRRRGLPHGWDGRIAGPLSALLGLVHGAVDGDALFFSRDIAMEGDTAAVVALRNAIDDAELDLLSLAAESFGPVAAVGGRLARPFAAGLARATGVALLRSRGPL
ncbi:MAG: sterol-binding protein [Rhodobacteraceae bacterium]|nr:MAG: sterol-binding protein [Paracoccaceae bacterium]